MAEEDKRPVAGEEASAGAPAGLARLSKNKKLTIAVIAVAVVAVLGIGLWSWGTSPSFCSALCHSPLDNYVAGYYEGDAGKAVTVHAKAGMNCLDCHDRSTARQLGEFAHWATDSYQVDDEGFLVKDESMLTKEFCTREGCHVWENVVDSTWGFAGNDEQYNPHASHQDGSITCNDCHKVHRTSELYCAKCHNMELPEGWVATSE